MAYPLAANDILEFQIVGDLHGQETRNTFHYYCNGAGDPDGASAIASMLVWFEDEVYSAIRARQSNEWTCVALTGQKIQPIRYRQVVRVPTMTAGAVVANSLPSYCAVVLSRYAEIATREGQGRIFVPGIPVSDEEDSELSDAAWALWVAVPGVLTLEMVPETGPPALPTLGRIVADGARLAVKTVALRRPLRVQRRREVGRGS